MRKLRFPYFIAAFAGLLVLAASGGQLAAETPETEIMNGSIPSAAAWGRVLERFHDAGGLDYAALAAAPEDLESYLASLASARPAAADRAERIAFWCNVYNAVTAKFVIERYPDIDSVKSVDGFFASKTFPVGGEELTLDAIEDRALAQGDPRVHFAVVCASQSCPDLRSEPYRGADLEAQLDSQTREFLADPSKGLLFEDGQLWLSSLFKWYAGDFTGGSTVVAFFARSKLLDWILPHLPEEQAREIRAANPTIRYLDYDWALNDR